MAEEDGLTREEIGAVQAIVMAVGAGKVRAQSREARRKAQKSRRET